MNMNMNMISQEAHTEVAARKQVFFLRMQGLWTKQIYV